MRISIVAAIGPNRELGRGNKLLWQIPEDMEHFRELTKGHAVIMGRNTFESIGRPLPDRINIVITRQINYSPSSFLAGEARVSQKKPSYLETVLPKTRTNYQPKTYHVGTKLEIVHSFDDAIKKIKKIIYSDGGEVLKKSRGDSSTSLPQEKEGEREAFVIGGGEIYAQALPYANRLYLTHVKPKTGQKIEADTYFPDYSQFSRVIKDKAVDTKDYKLHFLTLERPS